MGRCRRRGRYNTGSWAFLPSLPGELSDRNQRGENFSLGGNELGEEMVVQGTVTRRSSKPEWASNTSAFRM
jgi:hypothetical protein